MYAIYQYNEEGKPVLKDHVVDPNLAIDLCNRLQDEWGDRKYGACFIMKDGKVVGDGEGIEGRECASYDPVHERMGSVMTGREH